MEKITSQNLIRSNRKVLTGQEENKNKSKIKPKQRFSHSTPKNSISLSKRVLESPSSIDGETKIKKYKKNNFNLSEINLNQLVPLEFLEFPPPGSGKKPNYLSKSLFCKGGKFSPNNYYRKTNESPIFKYYDNGSFEKVKNEIESKNSFSLFMNQMNNEENDNELDNIEEENNNKIFKFQNDSSDDDNDGNEDKLTSFVKEVLKNNAKQEEKDVNYNNNNLYCFDYNMNNNNYYNENLFNNNINNNFVKQPMNVNININNNSNNNNYYYQYKENCQNYFNNNNNEYQNKRMYIPKKSSDFLHFQNIPSNRNKILNNNNNNNNNNNSNNNIINNINPQNNNNEFLNNLYYNQQQMLYYQQFINQNQMNYLYNQFNNQNNYNYSIYNNYKNPYRSYSSNDITKSLNSNQRLNNYQNNNFLKKNFNYNYTSLSNEELAKQAHLIVKIQSGCRFLEKKIEDNPELVDSLFFNNILSYVEELSTDQFGNYFIKKMFNYLSEHKLLQFIAIIFTVIKNVATDLYGTRVLQDLIDFLKTEKLLSAFVKIIIPYISLFVNDSNSVHIIYKLINLDNNLIENIHESLCNQILDIATNKKGCSFLKKYFETMKENQVNKIIKSIEENLVSIITDQYGNYCIQSIVLFQDVKIKENIIEQIAKNICFYSNQKFSSNVVEKCFEDNLIKDKVMKKMLIEENFHSMLLDNFGNYVVQKAINCSDEETQEKFFQMLVPLIPQLQKLNFGQKLFSKLLIQYPKFSLYMLNMNP